MFRSIVCIGGTTALTLTFFHPVMWLPVAACVGLAVLSLIAGVPCDRERPVVMAALGWAFMTVAIATAWGASQGFYNTAQLAFLTFGFVLGYLISKVRAPTWMAWAPYLLMCTYFLGMILLGRDPGEALTRNSRNFVSVIVLGLYATAVLVSKPTRVEPLHFVMAGIALAIALWSTGRGGIITATLLNFGLFVSVILRGRMGVIRTVTTIAILVVVGTGAVVAAILLMNMGVGSRLSERGLHDASRLAMLAAYFGGIEPIELVFGRNYYDDPFLARWEFNLHNSYLSAWAHLGLPYFMFLIGTMAYALRHWRTYPAIVIPVLTFGLRALTDTQMFAAKYDFIAFAMLFILLRRELREPSPHAARPALARVPAATASDVPGT